MSEQLKNKKVWIITEGIAGTENQCIGVAEALGVRPVVKRVTLREPWKSLSPTLGLEQWWTFKPELYGPWPDILITSGRKSIAAARYIKELSRGKTFTAHIQDPRISPAHFDLVAVPFHDDLEGDNVITTIAAPNRVTEEKLIEGRRAFPALAKIKAPVLTVLVGGDSKTHTFTKDRADALMSALQACKAHLLITMSRRTPKAVQEQFRSALTGPKITFWDGQAPNPYFAYLAKADAILVTSDSASMISEAATTGKPVYKFDLEGQSPKFNRFYRKLESMDILRNFEGKLEQWDYSPLADAQLVADAIDNAFSAHEKSRTSDEKPQEKLDS